MFDRLHSMFSKIAFAQNMKNMLKNNHAKFQVHSFSQSKVILVKSWNLVENLKPRKREKKILKHKNI